MKKTSFYPYWLGLLSGSLMWAAWPTSPFTPLIFIGFVPLLIASEKATSGRHFFWSCYTALLVWNVGTTWWIWHATAAGAVAAWLANSALMCIPWMLYWLTKKRLSRSGSYLLLITAWMGFEFLHLQDWGLSWPWLTLGNVFATHPEWVYWYSFTGTAGGTGWVLLINLLLFHHLIRNNYKLLPHSYKWIGWTLTLIISPILLSTQRLYPKPRSAEKNQEVLIVQPNIDPYQKIADGTSAQQIEKLISLSNATLTDTSRLLIWPETALYSPYGYDEERLLENTTLTPVWQLISTHPSLTLFTGIESYRWTPTPTRFSRPSSLGQQEFEAYNAGLLLSNRQAAQFYHKSMLVPGVETLPWFVRFMDSWFEKFGGVTAGYAKQDHRSVLTTQKSFRIAPAICYESIYGDFMRRYVKQGANLIVIITNDGWWKKTPGHRQHLHYARLRAIETGTWVARSANTGISAFIDPAGNIVEQKGYDQTATLCRSLPVLSASVTIYVRWGDWVSKVILLVGGLLSLLALVRSKKSI
ncbi:MAG: apolipoprotein N-acyltransferase [Sphingomonadales bacterium]